MSSSRTQCCDASETQTGGPSVLSQALYHSTTALPNNHLIPRTVVLELISFALQAQIINNIYMYISRPVLDLSSDKDDQTNIFDHVCSRKGQALCFPESGQAFY